MFTVTPTPCALVAYCGGALVLPRVLVTFYPVVMFAQSLFTFTTVQCTGLSHSEQSVVCALPDVTNLALISSLASVSQTLQAMMPQLPA